MEPMGIFTADSSRASRSIVRFKIGLFCRLMSSNVSDVLVLGCLWSDGPFDASTVTILKDVYARAKAAGKFKMTQQPDMNYTRNTMVASSFWDMRLSVTCMATDADFQNRIIIRDHTMNLAIVARQPHPDPNHAPPRRRTRP